MRMSLLHVPHTLPASYLTTPLKTPGGDGSGWYSPVCRDKEVGQGPVLLSDSSSLSVRPCYFLMPYVFNVKNIMFARIGRGNMLEE